MTTQTLPLVVPPRWTLSPWAQLFRRLTHWWLVGRHVRRFCQPLELEGMENLATLEGPAIFVANHTSHFDSYVVRSVLPTRLRSRAAIAAAADRWYTNKKLRLTWLSLNLNIYPIQRSGGREALSHSERLLEVGWSLIIFPEGTRAKRGHMEAFKHGVAILALGQNVPVVPIHLSGVTNILPPRERRLRPAPVKVRVGAPLVFQAGTSLQEATGLLQEAVQGLGEPHERLPLAPVAAR
jgi:1-acyl-sn-glycerol-3-phosphate acyltransferase